MAAEADSADAGNLVKAGAGLRQPVWRVPPAEICLPEIHHLAECLKKADCVEVVQMFFSSTSNVLVCPFLGMDKAVFVVD